MPRTRSALVVAVSIAAAALLAGCSGASGPDWSAYPGFANTDSDVFLSAPSLEAVTAESEEMLAEIRDTVTAEFGVVWIAEEPYDPGPDDNGFGGETMLRGLDAQPQWRGAVAADFPGARQRIHEIVGEVAARHDADSFTINNERDRLEPNRAEYYGAEDVEDQPLWSSHALGGPDDFYEIYTEVYDTAYPADPAYYEGEPDGLDGGPLDPGVPTISVALHVSSAPMLSEGDRAEFIERLKPYEGLAKPSGR